ncbi:hypothetical protein NMG60_11020592 [Bertholletia excelsa]
MGNYASCSIIPPKRNNSMVARVILPGGEIQQFREPVKAAELMLEYPMFFLVNSQSLHMGRRFSALAADEGLEFGCVYIMLHMKRVNSVATAADLALGIMAANSAARRITGGKVRILPESGGVPRNNSPGNEIQVSRLGMDDAGGFSEQEVKFRFGPCRSRKPTLDTIAEEPVSSR